MGCSPSRKGLPDAAEAYARRPASRAPLPACLYINWRSMDIAAVTAGLSLPVSSGPVEGNVNRTKMIKRQMYGRAGFDLLRKRILLTSRSKRPISAAKPQVQMLARGSGRCSGPPMTAALTAERTLLRPRWPHNAPHDHHGGINT